MRGVDAAVEVRVPGDKSISHRALMLASLADGPSRLRGVLASGDTLSTARALRALGVALADPSGASEELLVNGRGIRGWTRPGDTIDCGNSGTTARLLLGLLAGRDLEAVLTGDESLLARPMRRVTAPLEAAGATFQELGAPDRLPIRVRGGDLRAILYASPRASAQVKSALLLAGLTGGVSARVTEPVLSRDHTERLLRAMGAAVTTTPQTDGVEAALEAPAERLEPLDLTVPGDFSSAAFILAAALLGAAPAVRIRDVGLNPTRTGMLDVLRRMGADLRVEPGEDRGGEPAGDILASRSPLRATTVEAAEIPGLIDEVPVLAALAARAEGETRIEGASELRVKESDRLRALAENLRAVGGDAEDVGDSLVVRGTDSPLAGRVHAGGDHRIAMAFGVLAAERGSRIRIDSPGVAAVSYPGFWEQIERLGRP